MKIIDICKAAKVELPLSKCSGCAYDTGHHPEGCDRYFKGFCTDEGEVRLLNTEIEINEVFVLDEGKLADIFCSLKCEKYRKCKEQWWNNKQKCDDRSSFQCDNIIKAINQAKLIIPRIADVGETIKEEN